MDDENELKVVKEGYKINPTKENKHLSNVKNYHIWKLK